MTDWDALRSLAERQHGLLDVRQAAPLGLPPSTFWWQAANRSWNRVARGVVALPGSAPGPLRAVEAALHATGGFALAARWTAAWLWGLVPHPPSRVHLLLVPYARAYPVSPDVLTVRSRTVAAEDADLAQGIPVTTPARTICDLARFTSVPFLRSLVIDARQRGLTALAAIEETRQRMGAVKGSAALRRILWELNEERCDSVLEHVTRRRLREASLHPHPEPYPVVVRGRTIHIDIAFPPELLGLECLGLGYHSARSQLDGDALRNNLLGHTPWQIIFITWTRIEQDTEGLIREVRAALACRRHLAV